MQINNRFNEVFQDTPILGMIHLAGKDPVKRALKEIAVFEHEGIDGAIVENFHGSQRDVIATLEETRKLDTGVVIGINVLPNEYHKSFPLAKMYGADFIQLDYVAGRYHSGELSLEDYGKFKAEHPDVIVLGGVWPKYYTPFSDSNLEDDLNDGMQRAEAIVVTGQGTGKETSLDKIKKFREIIGDHPLIVGAGLTPENAYEQLSIADGAIIGTDLKVDRNTENPLDIGKVRAFMDVIREVRKNGL